MGRKKIEFESIEDERIRRVTFKKRRIGLIKKAIQMSNLTNTLIYMKIYCPEDRSLVEYRCTPEMNLENIHESAAEVEDVSKIYNSHYDMITKFEQRVDKTGHHQNIIDELRKNIGPDYDELTVGINMSSMFSLAKVRPREDQLEDQNTENGTKKRHRTRKYKKKVFEAKP